VLQAGGNAVDACIAACAVLGVVSPGQCGIGGDLFAIICSPGSQQPIVLNASGRAGSKATPAFIGDSRMPEHGALAVVTPGCVAGWAAALERFGSRHLSALLKPAIRLAEDGFPIGSGLARAMAAAAPQINSEAQQTFAPEGRVPQPGDLLRQPNLARSLRRVADDGPGVLYQGDLGEAIGRFLEQEGGHHVVADLASYAPEWVEPVRVDFRGYQVYTAPPNSQGLLHLLALSLLDPMDMGVPASVRTTHLQLEAMAFALEAARQAIADPEFVPAPVERLLSAELAAEGRSRIGMSAAPGRMVPAAAGDTVYLCAADREGTVVSMIQSLRQGFGCGLMVPGLGVVLNNRGRDFALADGDANQIAPGKRPRHTLSPGMVLRDGKAVAAYGTRGGDGQPYTMLQLGCNLLAFGMDPQAALDAPRWSVEPAQKGPRAGKVTLEGRFSQETVAGLAALGHETAAIDDFDASCGVASMIQFDGKRRTWLGGSDPRGSGLALGL